MLNKNLKDFTICALDNKTCIEEKDLNIILGTDNITTQEKARELNCSGGDNEMQLCIMQKLEKNKEIVKYFKPTTKSFSHTHWLNNTEIDTVQYQLMNNYKGYYYSNIHMIDFGMFTPSTAEHIDFNPIGLTNIDFVKELKGEGIFTENGKMNKYGVVVNTDISSGSGIHWFAVFIDFDSTPITIEYFNSSGYDIKNKEFKLFFINLANDISLKVRPCNFVKVSDIQHQNSSTSNCGVYALYYIWKRLGGECIDFFKKNKINDEHIVLFRKYFFRSN
jgi:hypothetical protein